jgi:hypothetical protein
MVYHSRRPRQALPTPVAPDICSALVFGSTPNVFCKHGRGIQTKRLVGGQSTEVLPTYLEDGCQVLRQPWWSVNVDLQGRSHIDMGLENQL